MSWFDLELWIPSFIIAKEVFINSGFIYVMAVVFSLIFIALYFTNPKRKIYKINTTKHL